MSSSVGRHHTQKALLIDLIALRLFSFLSLMLSVSFFFLFFTSNSFFLFHFIHSHISFSAVLCTDSRTNAELTYVNCAGSSNVNRLMALVYVGHASIECTKFLFFHFLFHYRISTLRDLVFVSFYEWIFHLFLPNWCQILTSSFLIFRLTIVNYCPRDNWRKKKKNDEVFAQIQMLAQNNSRIGNGNEEHTSYFASQSGKNSCCWMNWCKSIKTIENSVLFCSRQELKAKKKNEPKTNTARNHLNHKLMVTYQLDEIS